MSRTLLVHSELGGEVVSMARRTKPLTIKVTHRYVHDPEAVERGLQTWAMFLAEHLRAQLLAEVKRERAEVGSK
jgi:hypothetical protein